MRKGQSGHFDQLRGSWTRAERDGLVRARTVVMHELELFEALGARDPIGLIGGAGRVGRG